MDLDALLDYAVASAEIASGIDPAWVSHHYRRPAITNIPGKARHASWSKDETEFLRANITRLPVEAIAQHLGRSENAVKIHQVRHNIPAKSREPGFLTGNQAAYCLGVDIHTITKLHERGILPMEVLPGDRGILRISQTRFYMWATNHDHWMYFKTTRMHDLHLRRLVELAKNRWNDEWWSIGQAARHLGITIGGLNQAIRRGKVEAPVRWYNWHIRRSVVEKLEIRPGKGSAKGLSGTTPRQDEFMLRAAQAGRTCEEISRMMKWGDTRKVNHRLRRLGYYRTPQWMYEKKGEA